MNKERFINRTPKDELEIDTCDECGKEYQPQVWWQKYCKPSCGLAAHRKRNPRISPALMDDIKEIKKRLGME